MLLSGSRSTFRDTGELIPAAERHLDRAEQEFAERVFEPFWDEVEYATNKLAAYRNGIETINRNAAEYKREAANLTAPMPPFVLPVRELSDGRPTAHRLTAIVRRAQKDYQFATIYGPRKTNQILVAGFGTLASAIYAVGDAISCSLNDLSNNLHTSLDELLHATREHSSQTQSASDRQIDILAEQSRQAAAQATKHRKFEQEVVESQKKQEGMLDNIQRGHKPWP